MKNRVALVATTMLSLLVMGSCAEVDPDALPRTNLITGSTGSSWYIIGSAIAERTNILVPGHPLTGIPGAGGVSNPARVARLGDDLGITHLPFLRAAYHGEEPYTRAYPELRHIATLIENKLHVLISDRLDVTGFEDIRDQEISVRIGTGPPGSGEEFLLREVMSFYGISLEALRSWGGRLDLLGTGQRADAWRDNHLDIIVFSINDPASVVSEMLYSRRAKLWEAPDSLITHLQETSSVRSAIIPGGTYPGHPNPLRTIGMRAVIFGSEEVDERVVYALTKTIAENHTYLKSVHAGFKAWVVEDMLLNDDLPIHSGAARYFRERGWLQR